MKTIAVESTTLRTVAYDGDRKLLQLEFHNRTVYQYFNVPAAIHDGLLEAPSKGIYFNRFIRDKFDYAQVKTASLS
jgi:hypothetical protein